MDTRIYQLAHNDLQQILTDTTSTLQAGGLVVFPTETVYGIGANALDPTAAKRIYDVKGRPSDNPLIVHIATTEDLANYAIVTSNAIKPLTDAFWPGPLTLVLPKQDIIPREITGGLSTVAIRLPDNAIAQAIISASGLPICAPSANKSGTPSSTVLKHVMDDLFGKVDIIIDGGPSLLGLESTVLDLTSDVPTILRPGSVTKSMMEQVLGYPIQDASTQVESDTAPKAPGMKYKHYAPKGQVILLEGSHNRIVSFFNHLKDPEVGLIGSSELVSQLSGIPLFDLGSIQSPDVIAKNVFLALRSMDEQNIKTIYVETFEEHELGIAIMNRLKKAASNHIKHL